ncbi:MAG: ssDNA-binding protein, partial [Opitutia bacterium]
ESAGKLLVQDGDVKADYDGYPGNLFVNARAKTRPLVIDEQRAPLAEQDGKPYAGCYVNASIELWPQDNQYGKRINASLRGVQFARDGEAFAGGGAADVNDFDEVDAETGDLV